MFYILLYPCLIYIISFLLYVYICYIWYIICYLFHTIYQTFVFNVYIYILYIIYVLYSLQINETECISFLQFHWWRIFSNFTGITGDDTRPAPGGFDPCVHVSDTWECHEAMKRLVGDEGPTGTGVEGPGHKLLLDDHVSSSMIIYHRIYICVCVCVSVCAYEYIYIYLYYIIVYQRNLTKINHDSL